MPNRTPEPAEIAAALERARDLRSAAAHDLLARALAAVRRALAGGTGRPGAAVGRGRA
jgi:hypothetical protein